MRLWSTMAHIAKLYEEFSFLEMIHMD